MPSIISGRRSGTVAPKLKTIGTTGRARSCCSSGYPSMDQDSSEIFKAISTSTGTKRADELPGMLYRRSSELLHRCGSQSIATENAR
jgi:hypothetical protein